MGNQADFSFALRLRQLVIVLVNSAWSVVPNVLTAPHQGKQSPRFPDMPS
jgi:hypothetical protein